MALEHLTDEEYNVLKTQGISALSDDSYSRLKLPQGYGRPPAETGANPNQPFGTLNDAQDSLKQASNRTKTALGGGLVGKAVSAPSNLVASSIPTTPEDAVLTFGAGPLLEGMGLGAEALAKSKLGREIGEGAYKVFGNIYPKTAKYVMQNFDRVMGAKSVKEATQNYVDKIPGLSHINESMADRFGAVYNPSDFYNQAIEEAESALKTTRIPNAQGILQHDPILPSGKRMGPQEALDAIQALNVKERSIPINIKEKTLRAQALDEVHALKEDLYKFLGQSHPEVAEAAQGMKDAYAKEAVTKFLPRNIAGDVNVLRSVMGIASGHPLMATGPIGTTTAIRLGKPLVNLMADKGMEIGTAGVLGGKLLKKDEDSK